MPIARTLALAGSLVLLSLCSCAAFAASTPFTLHWTAPGDDSLTGRATVYQLRYSNYPITAANFLLAAPLAGLPTPAIAGTQETYIVRGLPDGVQFYLAMRSADERGNWSGLSNSVKRVGQTAGVGTPSSVEISLSQPWPNPAAHSAHWNWALPRSADVDVAIFDLGGRLVHTLAMGPREAGRGEWSWDLRDERGERVEPGLYFVHARLGSEQWTQRVVVVR
jgi:hypothetical protein